MILGREVIDFCYQSCAYQIYIRMKLNWWNFLTCRACRFLSRIKEVCIFQPVPSPMPSYPHRCSKFQCCPSLDLTRKYQRDVCQQHLGLLFLPQRARKWFVAQNREDLQLSSGVSGNSRLRCLCWQGQRLPEFCLAGSNYKTVLISERLM